MSSYPGLTAECVMFKGHNGDTVEAYYAKPSGKGPFPGVVLIHHAPGWDEWITEATRKLAHHGFATIAPHLYHPMVPAIRTTSQRRRAPKAASLTDKSSATLRPPWLICARNRKPAAKSA